jgi:hypothetical protein
MSHASAVPDRTYSRQSVGAQSEHRFYCQVRGRDVPPDRAVGQLQPLADLAIPGRVAAAARRKLRLPGNVAISCGLMTWIEPSPGPKHWRWTSVASPGGLMTMSIKTPSVWPLCSPPGSTLACQPSRSPMPVPALPRAQPAPCPARTRWSLRTGWSSAVPAATHVITSQRNRIVPHLSKKGVPRARRGDTTYRERARHPPIDVFSQL